MVSLTIKKPVPKLVEFHSVKKNKDSRITVTSWKSKCSLKKKNCKC